jgi:hypothetical protein
MIIINIYARDNVQKKFNQQANDNHYHHMGGGG